MRATRLLPACLALAGCATGAIPLQRTYVDPDSRVFDLVLTVVGTLDGETLYESRRASAITASFPGELEGPRLILDIRLERHVDETVVDARAHAGSSAVDAELLEALRERFFDELDRVAGGRLPGIHVVPGSSAPPSPGPGRP
jgi:hypothetical protein